MPIPNRHGLIYHATNLEMGQLFLQLLWHDPMTIGLTVVWYFGFYRGFSNDRGESGSGHSNQLNIWKIKGGISYKFSSSSFL